MNQQTEISNEEIDARIMVLINQRNKAMDENVILGSRVVILERELASTKEALKLTQDQLKELLFRESQPSGDAEASCTIQ